ncbi:MAG: phosphoribosylamine--glycine ligase [Alphaproteobacteria bacterium]|nr:MAG: phosphoribosylamine--glycine ligase [Alphaproteobacteria bacterium]
MNERLNILLIGSGGREHALAWKIAGSPRCGRLFCAPGNAGIAREAEIVDLDIADHGAVIRFCRDQAVDLVVIGPEAPLVAGIVDDLAAAGIRAFGPTAGAARLEGSKAFTKELCAQFAIPTAAWARFNNAPKAKRHVREFGAPIVVKADGLAAGKGVTVAMTVDEACAAIDDCFEGAFGAAGAEVVIEECLDGEEASLFALCDGRTALLFGTAQDHKRAFDGDTGPNTGGMGAYSPAPVLDQPMVERVMTDIIVPTLAGMAAKGAPFTGILYAGLMLTARGPQLIEYNVRFGDPECQVLMPRLKSDLVELMLAALDGDLLALEAEWSDDCALSVVMAAKGYPGAFEKGTPIGGLDRAEATGALVFHAGTALRDGRLVAAGGRVLDVTALAPTVAGAQAAAYRAVEAIDWPGGFWRRDIGRRAVEREAGRYSLIPPSGNARRTR